MSQYDHSQPAAEWLDDQHQLVHADPAVFVIDFFSSLDLMDKGPETL
ncbi:MAG: hypothetical protein LUC43_04990 [Burkholderiales bacterium]|nr:hypothetical protein [Burkholderiales bacterium]